MRGGPEFCHPSFWDRVSVLLPHSPDRVSQACTQSLTATSLVAASVTHWLPEPGPGTGVTHLAGPPLNSRRPRCDPAYSPWARHQ